MNTAELRARLEAEAIRQDAYDLTGDGRNEAYVLRQDPSGWSVFYSERGLESGLQTFASEADACEYLFEKLTSDPTTR